MNQASGLLRAGRVLRVIGGGMKRSSQGITLDLRRKSADFDHPWKCFPQWLPIDETDQSGWFMRVLPGLVNGCDVVNSRGVSLLDGGLVKIGGWIAEFPPPALEEAAIDKQVRKSEIILQTPRITASQEIDHGLFEGGGSLSIQTNFDAAIFNSVPRYQIVSRQVFEEPPEPDDLDFYMGEAVEPAYDLLKMATIWAISPDISGESPDETWTLHPQHHRFWNLNHASLSVNGLQLEPLKVSFDTALAGGIGNQTARQFLQSDADAAERVRAYLSATKSKGRFWSV